MAIQSLDDASHGCDHRIYTENRSIHANYVSYLTNPFRKPQWLTFHSSLHLFYNSLGKLPKSSSHFRETPKLHLSERFHDITK